MKFDTEDGRPIEITDVDIREWFLHENLEQADETLLVCEGIMQTRRELDLEPKRKRRKDAGIPRKEASA